MRTYSGPVARTSGAFTGFSPSQELGPASCCTAEEEKANIKQMSWHISSPKELLKMYV